MMARERVPIHMAKLDIVQSALISAPASPPIAIETVSALATAGGFIEMLGVWQALMRKQVFPLVDLSHNRTQENTFQKRLLSQPGMSVLMIVWKDSSQVRDAEIEAAGAVRVGSVCSPINCHNLAKRMATGIEDYDRQEKLIQGIVKAAEAYGLIERAKFGSTRQLALRGTELLHQLMLSFDEDIRPICSDIAGSGPGGL
jgi:hypothetical protein